MGSCLYFRLWVCWILRFVWFATLQAQIITFLQRHSISWTFKSHRVQGLTSNVCGHYCSIYPSTEPGGKRWRHSCTCLYLLATPATIKRQYACSALNLECVKLATSWRSSRNGNCATSRGIICRCNLLLRASENTIYLWSHGPYIYWNHSARITSTNRRKSTGYQLHVCMSQHFHTCLCFADSLFISSMAKLSHS